MDQTGGGRARRIDAQANRGRILDVAEEVFGRGGESTSTEEVARLAGVGIATVFRHFPTKAALLQAVLVRRYERLREQAEALRDSTDPGTAFFDFFRHLVADAATKIAIGEALLDAGGEPRPDGGSGDGSGDGSEAAQASAALRRAVGTLLRHAQRAGAVRDDVDLPEVYALLVAVSRATAPDEVKAGALAIVFDGLTPARPRHRPAAAPHRQP